MILKDSLIRQFRVSDAPISDESLAALLFPVHPDSAELIVAVPQGDFSASAMARAVEDAEAHLINLNLLSDAHSDGRLLVALRIDHRNTAAAARSLERYGMEVVAATAQDVADGNSEDPHEERARQRALELLRILDM